MSSPFARMTSSLLVRKGDAAPSVVELHLRRTLPHDGVAPDMREPAPLDGPAVSPRQATAGRQAREGETLHRIRVTVTAGDLQRIGIAAVKAGVSRQKIVHAALQAYFQEFAADLGQPCSCLAGEPCLCATSDGQQLGRPHPMADNRRD